MLGASAPAQAAATFFIAGDDFATSFAEMPNASAQAALFDATAPLATRVDFESAVPAGITFSSNNILSGPPVVGCQHRCGFNTTAGGAFHLSHGGFLMTMNFANPVNRFGVYLTGLQASLVGGPVAVSLNDGTAYDFNLPGIEGGGGAFFGFTTTGAVNSIAFQARSDIIGFDDIRFDFVNAAVPEPATWAMMIGGFGLVGGAMRRRSSVNTTVRFA